MLLAPAVLRADAQFGFAAIVFLFAVVWATDIVAYFAGRAVGGPKLWPRVSPNKTWSGAIGGTTGGSDRGCRCGGERDGEHLACCRLRWSQSCCPSSSQAGDLFESAIKRRFGAKDAGQLIPGHGGVMDRLDGFVFAAAAGAAIGMHAWRHRRRPRAACWCGEHGNVPLARSQPNPAAAVASVTVLGATGSIGASTIDLLTRERARYRVEAVSANTQCGRCWRSCARDSTRALPPSPTRSAYRELKEALAGSGIEAARRRRRRGGSRAAAGRLGHGRDQRRRPGSSRRWRRVERGATVALANKECLVCAGALVHAPRGERPARPSCRSIPSTTRCSRRWAPAAARTCGA